MTDNLVIALCTKCKKCVNGVCTDVFNPEIMYGCINFEEKKADDNKSDNAKC